MGNPFDPGSYCSEELRGFGFAHVGENVRIAKNCVIIGPENIEIGDNSRVDAFTGIFATTGRLRVGRRVHISGHCHFAVAADLTFGDYSGTSQGVKIYTGNDDYSGGALLGPCVPREYRDLTVAPVTVARMGVLGAGSVVFPGVTIGEGATIGANAVVHKDAEPWGIYTGNPMRKCGTRSESAAQLAAELDRREALAAA